MHTVGCNTRLRLAVRVVLAGQIRHAIESPSREMQMGVAKSDVQSETRERAIALFKYLLDVAEKRSKITRNYRDYESTGAVIRIVDVPVEKECFIPAREPEQQDVIIERFWKHIQSI